MGVHQRLLPAYRPSGPPITLLARRTVGLSRDGIDGSVGAVTVTRGVLHAYGVVVGVGVGVGVGVRHFPIKTGGVQLVVGVSVIVGVAFVGFVVGLVDGAADDD